jgi:hypothetical protein
MTPRHQTKGPPSAGLFVGTACARIGKTAERQSGEVTVPANQAWGAIGAVLASGGSLLLAVPARLLLKDLRQKRIKMSMQCIE